MASPRTRKAFADAEKQAVAKMTEAVRSFALKLYSDVRADSRKVGSPPSGYTYGSAVRTGWLAASWNLSIGSPNLSTAPGGPVKPYPRQDLGPAQRTIANEAIAQAASLMRTFKLGQKIFIANAVPYAASVEAGRRQKGGRTYGSNKAPGGILRPTILWNERRFGQAFENVRIETGVRER